MVFPKLWKKNFVIELVFEPFTLQKEFVELK